MVSDCGHRCCPIPGNTYHRHLTPPEACERCRRRARDDPSIPVARLPCDITDLYRAVMAHVAPQIPGLPAGTDLEELVRAEVLTTYLDACAEDGMARLDPPTLRRVLAGRVALALAFPEREGCGSR